LTASYYLEEKVAVDEPSGVSKSDELHDLGKQRHGVDGADDDGGQPKSEDGAAGICDDGGLVLDGVPLGFQVGNELVAAGGRGVVGGGLRPEQRQPPRRI